jgi:hypothetical protein
MIKLSKGLDIKYISEESKLLETLLLDGWTQIEEKEKKDGKPSKSGS